MVKGRRVRAVVACARNDDCCSPDPKRRDQKIPFNSNNAITAFFQAVNIEINENKALEDEIEINPITTTIDVQKNEQDFLLGLCHKDLNDHNHNVNDDDTPTTPVMVRKMTCNNETGPPTPHRIELCLDDGKEAANIINNKTEGVEVKPKKRLNNKEHGLNHKLTEYFPVRRSIRKTKKIVLEEKQRSLEQILRNDVEEGLEVRIFGEKGRGVVASRFFNKGDFVVEYSGDLIDIAEAKQRENKYAQDQNTGCYMYYFKHNNQQYCVDATAESGRLGRLVNHSRTGNLLTRTVSVDSKPRLVLIAKNDIKEGDELTYDYGDRSKESLKHHPWLAY